MRDLYKSGMIASERAMQEARKGRAGDNLEFLTRYEKSLKRQGWKVVGPDDIAVARLPPDDRPYIAPPQVSLPPYSYNSWIVPEDWDETGLDFYDRPGIAESGLGIFRWLIISVSVGIGLWALLLWSLGVF